MAGPPPLFDLIITPAPATWFGEAMNYSASLGILHSGGTAPFTYFWNTDGAVFIPDRTLPNIDVTSANGPPVSLTCTVIDAAGQTAFAIGSILGVAGGGGG